MGWTTTSSTETSARSTSWKEDKGRPWPLRREAVSGSLDDDIGGRLDARRSVPKHGRYHLGEPAREHVGLHQVGCRGQPLGLFHELAALVFGEHDHRDVTGIRSFAQGSQHLHPVEHGKVYVEQDHVRTKAARKLETGGPVG